MPTNIKPDRFSLSSKITEFIQGESFLDFDALALELCSYQLAHNPVYRKIAKLSNEELPLLSISLFKNQKIFCRPDSEIQEIFYSSGTTQKNKSKHFLSAEELRLYELSLKKSFIRAFGLSVEEKISYLALSESCQEKPNNSLIYMFDFLRKELFGIEDPNKCFLIKNSSFDFELLEKSIEENKKILLVGTSLAFHRLIEELKTKQFRELKLPKASSIMETGGFKTQEKSISKDSFYRELQEFFLLERAQIINQYGMSEIGTQFYDFYQNRIYQEKFIPHWCKIKILNPKNLQEELPALEPGVVAIYDLSNLDSCAFILTEDFGFKTDQNTFQILGRIPQTDLKGCSLNY